MEPCGDEGSMLPRDGEKDREDESMIPAFTEARRLLAKRAEWEKRKGIPTQPPPMKGENHHIKVTRTSSSHHINTGFVAVYACLWPGRGAESAPRHQCPAYQNQLIS